MRQGRRLQILVSEEEAEQFRRTARREGTTLSERARTAMRDFQERRRSRTADNSLRAFAEVLEHPHPTGDVEQLLSEIETGRDLR